MSTPEYPLVSVAMCTYNGERFLRQQLDSLIAQDYPNLEIIISDDCSTDNTVEILTDYQKKHLHLYSFQNKTNLGFTRNFEEALSHCSGDFIALCDQDDVWFPEKISTLIKQIGTSTLIYTPVQMIDEREKPIDEDFYSQRKIQPVSGKCNKALIFNNCVIGHTCLFPRKLLKFVLPFPESIDYHDHWIAFMAATTGEIQFYNKVLSLYRMHQNNVALKNRGGKKSLNGFLTRRIDRDRRRRKKYRKTQSLLNTFADLKLIPEEERRIFSEIAQSYTAFYRVRYNRRLSSLIQKEGDAFLAISLDKKKALKKICRGYLAGIFR